MPLLLPSLTATADEPELQDDPDDYGGVEIRDAREMEGRASTTRDMSMSPVHDPGIRGDLGAPERTDPQGEEARCSENPAPSPPGPAASLCTAVLAEPAVGAAHSARCSAPNSSRGIGGGARKRGARGSGYGPSRARSCARFTPPPARPRTGPAERIGAPCV
jgi:hypothetical protein